MMKRSKPVSTKSLRDPPEPLAPKSMMTLRSPIGPRPPSPKKAMAGMIASFVGHVLQAKRRIQESWRHQRQGSFKNGKLIMSPRSVSLYKAKQPMMVFAACMALILFLHGVGRYNTHLSNEQNTESRRLGEPSEHAAVLDPLSRANDPTPFTVRNYYNTDALRAEIRDIPWLFQYLQWQEQSVTWDYQKKEYTLNPGVNYLKVCWCCRNTDIHKHREADDDETVDDEEVCQDPNSLADQVNGVLSAFYAAVLSKRVLIVDTDEQLPTSTWSSLPSLLGPNVVKWNVRKYPTPEFKKTIRVEDEHDINYLQELCHLDSNTVGIELHINKWIGSDAIWNSRCMHKLWTASQTDPKAHGEQPKHLYRWGFWSLFQMSDDVLGRADLLRNNAGLELARGTPTPIMGYPPYYASGIETKLAPDEDYTPYYPPYYASLLPGAKPLETHHGRQVAICSKNLFDEARKIVAPQLKQLTKDEQAKTKVARNMFLSVPKLMNEDGTEPPDGSLVYRVYRLLEKPDVDKQTFKAVVRKKRDPLITELSVQDRLRDHLAELVILVEAECLLLVASLCPTQPSGDRKGRWSDIAARISISNMKSKDRCAVGLDECMEYSDMKDVGKENPLAWALRTLYWTQPQIPATKKINATMDVTVS